MIKALIDSLCENRSLKTEEYVALLDGFSPEAASYAAHKADKLRRSVYGNSVFVRGLIEISNICKNDCLYCGIRKSNANCRRYRLNPEEILSCCDEGYDIGFRTFVMQGGEDAFFTDGVLCGIIERIKSKYPDCAVTLSLGERSAESYQRLFDAGADRYLLRHETADPQHYGLLHPKAMSFENRINCLKALKKIGFQTGCGFMVGSPGQTSQTLAADLKLIEEFKPEMCGIGPFIPHRDTPFAAKRTGSTELTYFLLSVIRLISPEILLPATTALGTLDPMGRERGISAGANVIMPNLSPRSVRKKYELYNNKLSDGDESAECLESLKKRISSVGYEIVTDRGDIRRTAPQN